MLLFFPSSSSKSSRSSGSKLVEWATEIKVRAERRAGGMLAEMPKLSGARGVGKKVGYHRGIPLAEIDRKQGKRSNLTSFHHGGKLFQDVCKRCDYPTPGR